jgi:hypothetical protein
MKKRLSILSIPGLSKTGRVLGIALLLCVSPLCLFAVNIGFVTEQGGDYSSSEDLNYAGTYLPWLSWTHPGRKLEIYASGRFSLEYKERRESQWFFIPEAGRLEAVWQPLNNLTVEIGRQGYHDGAGLVAQGLFDGLSASYRFGKHRLGAGVYYTGLLFSRTVNIAMTPRDLEEYNDNDHYFAPKRVLGSLQYEIASFLSGRASLHAGALAQFDLRDDDTLHSQYGILKFNLAPVPRLNLELAGVAGLSELADENLFSAAASGGFVWTTPSKYGDRLGFFIRWGSGSEGGLDAFSPITSHGHGRVFSPDLGGAASARLSYELRMTRALFFDVEAAYFIRTGTETFVDDEMKLDHNSGSPHLGPEFFASVTFAPLSDLSFNAGAGVFLPCAWGPWDTRDPRWKVQAALILSL